MILFQIMQGVFFPVIIFQSHIFVLTLSSVTEVTLDNISSGEMMQSERLISFDCS